MKETVISLNPKQFAFMQAVTENQADTFKDGLGYQGGFRATFQGGRGSGKTNELLQLIVESAFQLPRARAGLAGLTYRQVQDIILSQSQDVFESHGLHEYNPKTNFGHYVVNRRPPDDWVPAYNKIRTYDHSLVFRNGYSVQLISADRPETLRGANLDQLFIDESATFKEEIFNKVLRPTIRANKYKYQDPRKGRKGLNHPLHWLIADFTSAPWLPQGQWIYKTEDLMKVNPSKYHFLEATAYDNIHNLPGGYIEDQKETLTPIQFDLEILNRRLTKLPNSFYSAYDPLKHTYQQSYSYEYDDQKRIYTSQRNDYDPTKPIELGLDFNADFTSMLLCQEIRDELKFFDVLWVKESTTTLADSIAETFTTKYKDHKRKVIYMYGDHSGRKRDPGRRKTLFQTIIDKLKESGWQVIDCIQQSYPPYLTRYQVINAVLQEGNAMIPKVRIAETECKALHISLQNAGVIGNDFEKDKRSEQNKATPQEYATHLSDIFDYIIFKKYSKHIKNGFERKSKIIIR